MRVILIAGWNEQSDLMRTFIDGRQGIEGLAAFGFDCTIFPADGDDLMRDRIDRFAGFLTTLKDREPGAFPVATFGYSVGGLINRGFLRAYPERAGEIAATVQLAAPNGGLITNYTLGTMRLARVPTHILADIDVEAPFMSWLNGVGGSWVPDPDHRGKQRWKLDGEPWVIPEGHPLLHIVGRVPRYHLQSDGVVMIESATLDGAMPCVTIDDDAANHLNLGAVSNIFASFFRRFAHDDSVWPRCVALTARFLRSEPMP